MTAPKDFIFSIKYPSCSPIFSNLYKFYNTQHNTYYSTNNLTANLKTGLHKFDNVEMWILNKTNSNWISVYFKSKDEWLKLEEIINKKLNQSTYKIYKMSGYQWTIQDQYTFRGEDDLIGYDSFVRLIEKDMDNSIKYKKFLDGIGETKSNNYLLYGEPGTGKTTLVRTLASKYKLPIYIVSASSAGSIDCLFNLKNDYDKSPFKILLFEDFDRYVLKCNEMSEILNSLDGVVNSSGVIRFFTANDPKIIFSNKALTNRISSKFEFKLPTRDIFVGKLKRLLSYHSTYDNDKFNQYINLVCLKNITIRPFTNYTIRYMFDDNFLDALINNIDLLN